MTFEIICNLFLDSDVFQFLFPLSGFLVSAGFQLNTLAKKNVISSCTCAFQPQLQMTGIKIGYVLYRP